MPPSDDDVDKKEEKYSEHPPAKNESISIQIDILIVQLQKCILYIGWKDILINHQDVDILHQIWSFIQDTMKELIKQMKDNKARVPRLWCDVGLYGHCVVKLVDNNKHSNQINLLSFGSSSSENNKHTLLMKYAPFTNNHNHPIQIGKNEDDYRGVRGSNNHLLFITYYPKYISVFDLNMFQFIKHDTLSIATDYIDYHCFASKLEKGRKSNRMFDH
ncbi:hypothetical protein RFI_30216 [Reticulomyxa filosa]|uniref:Uncharacterized protein n=1 Tax=Reticulomyxa filosa TaxID=46433 RepID=X6M2G9_RETFI|nr:hypothetical protein RFI_30216 [Reticulomyxa filosa]|eukprot:ETO07175.1 hypothetical protein RFI_30216 [Reticulomyxa filosa]